MNRKLLAGANVALFAVLILFTPSFVTAHHTWVVQYDRDDIVILEGTVSEIRLISPHSRIFIEVDGTDGPGIWAAIQGAKRPDSRQSCRRRCGPGYW